MLGKKTGIVKKPGFSSLFSRRGVNRQKRNTLAPDRGPFFNGLAQKLLTVLQSTRNLDVPPLLNKKLCSILFLTTEWYNMY